MTIPFRRENVIDKVLAHVSRQLAAKGQNDLICAEVGTAFSEDQGSSTLRFAQAVAAGGEGGRLWSIDNNPTHLEQSAAILERAGIQHDSRIIFCQDFGRTGLRRAVEATPHFDLVYLDGGGHPEHNLDEFQVAYAHLREGGVILVDDAQIMQPTPAYGLSRPFGKSTLILPYLIIAEYLNSSQPVLTEVVKGWRGGGPYPVIDYRILHGRMVLCGPAALLSEFD